MLTDEDVKKLIETQKEIFPTKVEMKETIKAVVDEKIDELGRMVKRSFDNFQTQLDRIENILIKDHEMRLKRMEDALLIK